MHLPTPAAEAMQQVLKRGGHGAAWPPRSNGAQRVLTTLLRPKCGQCRASRSLQWVLTCAHGPKPLGIARSPTDRSPLRKVQRHSWPPSGRTCAPLMGASGERGAHKGGAACHCHLLELAPPGYGDEVAVLVGRGRRRPQLEAEQHSGRQCSCRTTRPPHAGAGRSVWVRLPQRTDGRS